MKEYIIPCDCGISPYYSDHNVSIYYDDEYMHLDGGEIYISTSLCHYMPWYRRIKLAFMYVLGVESQACFYKETVISKDKFIELIDQIKEEIR